MSAMQKNLSIPLFAFKSCCWLMVMINAVIVAAQSKPSTYSIEAQQLQKHGKISEAILNYKLDYQNTKDKWEALEIAALYAVVDSVGASFKWLYLATKEDSSLAAMEEYRFFNLLGKTEWQAFENQQIRKYELKNGGFKNLSLSRKLWRIGMKDQAYSYEINVATRVLGEASPITKALWVLQKKNRQENLDDAEAIIKKHGWPKISEVGEEAAEKIFWVVQHAQGERARKKFLPKLKKACEKKEAKWMDYATMYDRLSLEETGKQLYGTQLHREDFNGAIELSPLESPEYVEKRRKEMGLPPLVPTLERMGIKFDVIQKE